MYVLWTFIYLFRYFKSNWLQDLSYFYLRIKRFYLHLLDSWQNECPLPNHWSSAFISVNFNKTNKNCVYTWKEHFTRNDKKCFLQVTKLNVNNPCCKDDWAGLRKRKLGFNSTETCHIAVVQVHMMICIPLIQQHSAHIGKYFTYKYICTLRLDVVILFFGTSFLRMAWLCA